MRLKRCWTSIACVVSLALLSVTARAAVLAPGDLLIADYGARAILEANTSTGVLTVMSHDGSFVNPMGIAIGSNGLVYVADAGVFGPGTSGTLFRIDPATGAQAVVSTGSLFSDPEGVAVAPNGTIYVLDSSGLGGHGGVIRVDPKTGAQTAVASGGSFVAPRGIVIGTTGLLYVADLGGRVLRIDPNSGSQATVASIPNAFGIGLDQGGSLLVTLDSDRQSSVTRVNPTTGAQTVLTTGGFLFAPQAATAGAGPDIFVLDQIGVCGTQSCNAALVRVNGVTGAQTLVTNGPPLFEPSGVVPVPALATPAQSETWGRVKSLYHR